MNAAELGSILLSVSGNGLTNSSSNWLSAPPHKSVPERTSAKSSSIYRYLHVSYGLYVSLSPLCLDVSPVISIRDVLHSYNEMSGHASGKFSCSSILPPPRIGEPPRTCLHFILEPDSLLDRCLDGSVSVAVYALPPPHRCLDTPLLSHDSLA